MRPLVAALALAVLGATAPANAAPPDGREHLLVVIDLSGPEARILGTSVVARALPRGGGPARGWELLVEDARGRVLHRGRTAAGGTLRGEQVVDGRLEAITAPDPRAAIAVRVPILPNAAIIRLLAREAGPPAARPSRSPGTRLEERAVREVEVARVEYPQVPR